MYAPERREAMATFVARRRRAAVSDLAERFGVTTETVRRDLDQLEEQGLLRRVHGGAVPAGALAVLERSVAERDIEHAAAKEAIARTALDLLPPAGGSVVLDAGTTTGRLVDALPLDLELRAFTNALPLAVRLAARPRIELHLLGGHVRGTTRAAVGPGAVAALADVRADVAFMGTNGISLAGCTTPDDDEAAAKRAMVAAVRTVVVLADASKIGREAVHVFARLTVVDVVVTDADADPDDLRALQDAGTEVLVA